MLTLIRHDVDKAVELVHFALFYIQGQCCGAGSRIYVHERVYDEYLEKAKARAVCVVGDPFKRVVEHGPQDNMLIAQDGIFGPVQSISKFRDINEVIERANSTSFGLAAGAFTHDIDDVANNAGAFTHDIDDVANNLACELKAGKACQLF